MVCEVYLGDRAWLQWWPHTPVGALTLKPKSPGKCYVISFRGPMARFTPKVMFLWFASWVHRADYPCTELWLQKRRKGARGEADQPALAHRTQNEAHAIKLVGFFFSKQEAQSGSSGPLIVTVGWRRGYQSASLCLPVMWIRAGQRVTAKQMWPDYCLDDCSSDRNITWI